MAGAWLPGAQKVPTAFDGGRFSGGAPRVVWHTTESDPRGTAAAAAAQHLEEKGCATHLVWNPLTGELVQMLPAVRPARSLGDLGGDLEPSREGRLCLQIDVVAFSTDPFTSGPLHGLAAILRWLDSWNMPRRWPAGPPPAEPISRDSARDRARWSRGGHFGHSQVPGNAHFDPGALDIRKLTANPADAPAATGQPGVAAPGPGRPVAGAA